MRVSGQFSILERQNGKRQVITALQTQELVLAQGLVPVGARGVIEEARELLHVPRFELRDDLYVVHIREYPDEYRQRNAGARELC